jgi:hypothetical protein
MARQSKERRSEKSFGIRPVGVHSYGTATVRETIQHRTHPDRWWATEDCFQSPLPVLKGCLDRFRLAEHKQTCDSRSLRGCKKDQKRRVGIGENCMLQYLKEATGSQFCFGMFVFSGSGEGHVNFLEGRSRSARP